VTVVGTLLAPLYKRLNKLESAGFLTAPALATALPVVLTNPTTFVNLTGSGTYALPGAIPLYKGYVLGISNASGGTITITGALNNISLTNGRGATFYYTGTVWRCLT
jgi:hypothetical protein